MIRDRLDQFEQALQTLLERTATAPTWPRFLDLETAATYTSLSVKSLRRMISRGDLQPCRPVRGKVLLDRTELDAVILGTKGTTLRRGRGIR